MKRLLFIAANIFLASTLSFSQNLRFASHPSLSPDGKQIYFSYDGDIFSVPVSGGQATAVITMTGEQDSPLVSPDGKWLAFSSDIQGNTDVYAVPLGGGKAVQLTFHEAPDVPISWSADSKYIYFESTRESARKTSFRVAVEGGTPQLMFDGYFNTIVTGCCRDIDKLFNFFKILVRIICCTVNKKYYVYRVTICRIVFRS